MASLGTWASPHKWRRALETIQGITSCQKLSPNANPGWHCRGMTLVKLYRPWNFKQRKPQKISYGSFHEGRYSIHGISIDLKASLGTWASTHLWRRALETIRGMTSCQKLPPNPGWHCRGMTLVRPNLEYGCSVWDPNQAGQIANLEKKIFKRAARFVTGTDLKLLPYSGKHS